jgi:hypothetical protein
MQLVVSWSLDMKHENNDDWVPRNVFLNEQSEEQVNIF